MARTPYTKSVQQRGARTGRFSLHTILSGQTDCEPHHHSLQFNHARNLMGQSTDRTNMVAHLYAPSALASMVLAAGGE